MRVCYPFCFMPHVTFIRHGQAGTRDNYDILSDTGTEQARLLGDWFGARGVRFDKIISGSLRRQIETARAVFGAESDGLVSVDPAWNEFDLDAVFDGVANKLADSDVGFARRWAAIQAEVAAGGTEIHRQWTEADGEVMWAWISNRFGEIDGVESWPAFHNRIRRALNDLRGAGDRTRIAVFTSALPTAFCIAEALGLDQDRILRLAGASYNTGITEITLEEQLTGLISFNVASHLPGRLLTCR